MYDKGARDQIAFGLSGLLFKREIALNSAEKLFASICDSACDQEKEGRLQVLCNTYANGMNGEEIAGSIWLAETIYTVVGDKQVALNTVTKISKILSGRKSRSKIRDTDKDGEEDNNKKITFPIDDLDDKDSQHLPDNNKIIGKGAVGDNAQVRKAKPIYYVKKFSTGILLAEAIIVNK